MSINTTTMKRTGAYHGDQRVKLPVYDSGFENGNRVLNMDHPMRELFVANDSLTDNLTIVVTGDASLSLTFTLKPEDAIDERLPEFTTVTVTASDAWRWYVRSGRIT